MNKVAILAALVSTLANAAIAQERCRITDPTGTPLNLRAWPAGEVIGAIPNGRVVFVRQRSKDREGRPWVYVADRRTGVPLGWVYREFVSCY